jgi:hypothetical protein
VRTYLTPGEKEYICSLILAEKETIKFLRGFGKPTQEEQNKSAEFNRLINKIERL